MIKEEEKFKEDVVETIEQNVQYGLKTILENSDGPKHEFDTDCEYIMSFNIEQYTDDIVKNNNFLDLSRNELKQKIKNSVKIGFKNRYLILSDLIRMKKDPILFRITPIENEDDCEYAILLKAISFKDKNLTEEDIVLTRLDTYANIDDVANLRVKDNYYNIFFGDITPKKIIRLKLRKK